MDKPLSVEQMEALRRLDTCTLSNAIETFDVKLRNEGFADASIRCMVRCFPNMLGYAATARIRTSSPPPVGHTYPDRTDWWNYVLTLPAPRVIVVEDVDERPGFGAFLGEVHTNISLALGCVGVVTNGAVRDLDPVEASGFHVFAGNVAVSHAYVHMVEFGTPVQIGGLKIQAGDLLHGDRHGVQVIPQEIAAEIPAVAARILENERKVIGLCRSPQFSLEKLRAAVKELG